MSVIMKINVLVLLLVGICAFANANPVSNTITTGVFASANADIKLKLNTVATLCLELSATVQARLKLQIVLKIIDQITVIVNKYKESCNQMKPSDANGLLVNLQVALNICIQALVVVKNLNVTLAVYINAVLQLLAVIQAFISVLVNLVLWVSVNIKVDLTAIVNIFINIGLSILAKITLSVFAAIKLCFQLIVGVSIDIKAIISVLLNICANINVALNLTVSVAVQVFGYIGAPAPCNQVVKSCGNLISAVVSLSIGVLNGQQDDATGLLTQVDQLTAAIKATANVNLSANINVIVKSCISACVAIVQPSCSCYKDTCTSMTGSSTPVTKIAVSLVTKVSVLIQIGIGINI